MKILRLTIFLLFLGSCSAFAGELDSYYLQEFGELTTDSPKAVLKSAQAPTPHKCGMPLHHNLKRDWKKLETGTQKTLAKYLEKPTLTDVKTVISNGNHFRIHYASSGPDAPPLADNDNNAIPDWVETVADVFEAVYDKEVTTMKYRTPPNMPYDVYLRTLTNFLGLTTSDIVNGQSATSFIEIDKDFQNFSISGVYSPLGLLKITAAHEFQHAIQYGYNFYFEAWYAEASATWIEDEVYDSVNQLYDYTGDYLTNTASPLGSGNGYSRWIFNRYLYEQDPSQDKILKIWSTFASEQPIAGTDIPMLNFIDNKVLKPEGGSLAASFFGFAKRTYLRNWSSHSNEISRLHPVSSVPVSADNSHLLTNPTLPSYSFTYYKFTHSTNTTSTLTINYPDKPLIYSVVAFKDSDKTEYNYDSSTKSITIPVFGANDSIYLLVCNNSTVTPPASSGNGGGGGCFIATAAYGSYLHPEVMTLRDFRNRYLLTNLPGRAFVAFYYRISPPIADFISEHESARLIVRVLLAPIIFAVKHLAAVLAAAAILLLLACSRLWKRSATKTATVTESK